jgi:thiamine biosynthesis lipoprotein
MEHRRELTVARRAMACEFSITLPAGTRAAADAACAALDEIERLEQKLSVYLDDSLLSGLNRNLSAGPLWNDAELYTLLRRAAALSAATGGAFDPASGALLKAWGFFRGPRRVPADDELTRALSCSGCRHIVFDDAARTIRAQRPGIEFNLGAIGKGYAIDRAASILRNLYGIRSALVQGGQSSLYALGAPPGDPRGWQVAIGDPCRPGRTVATVWLRDRALGTSGSDHQYFVHAGRRYGHVLDPRTGVPARGALSASAFAPTAAEADALSTAFFVMGIDSTLRFCARHTTIGALLVVPGRIVRIGAAGFSPTPTPKPPTPICGPKPPAPR